MARLARITCALLALLSSAVSGQGVTVRGLAYDSLHARPLSGAFVALGTKSVTSDSAGRFEIAGVEPGTYRVTAQHDDIDRVGLSAVGGQVKITDGADPVVVALPSFAGLWKLVCGPKPPAADTGFVFGTVRSPRRVRRTTVYASWIDLAASGTKVSQKLKILEVVADSLGNFALCGVPTTTGLSLRAAGDSTESGTFIIDPLDRERVLRRDLTLGTAAGGAIAPGRGATLSGRVLADSGHVPISNADVTLIDAAQSTTTNEQGEYAFRDIGAGTQRLWVRKIGYAEVEVRLDFEEAQRREYEVLMKKITVLDSVKVTEKVLARDEALRSFEEHRKMGLGKFLTLEDLEKNRSAPLSTLLRPFPGIYIPSKNPLDTYPQTTRGVKSFMGGCSVAVFFDGRLLDPKVDRDLNHIAPPDILAGVEWYPGGATVPPEYQRLNTHCGVLVLHSRYKTGK